MLCCYVNSLCLRACICSCVHTCVLTGKKGGSLDVCVCVCACVYTCLSIVLYSALQLYLKFTIFLVYTAMTVPCVPKADIVLVLDHSGSINHADPRNWDRVIDFVVALIDRIQIGRDATRIAIVEYGKCKLLKYRITAQ